MDREESPYYRLLYVSASKIHGEGVFTSGAIPKDALIGEFAGTFIVKDIKYAVPRKDPSSGMVYFIEGTGKLKYVNHSQDPNSVLLGHKLVALRDIEPDEEITWDYGRAFHRLHHPNKLLRWYYRSKWYLVQRLIIPLKKLVADI